LFSQHPNKKGRDPIQVTGRSSYKLYGDLPGVDLISNPTQAAAPEVGFRIAGVYWQRNGLNELADRQFFKTMTKRINGGFNGLEDRVKYYGRAKGVLLGGSGGMALGDAEAAAGDYTVDAPAGDDYAPEDTGDDSKTRAPHFSRGNEEVVEDN
jgi:Predicted chitinase